MRAVGYFSEALVAGGPGSAGATLSQQNDQFLRFCDSHGYEPAAAFLDPNLTSDRSGFRQLLQYLDQPDKGFLVVWLRDFNRLGGDPVEAARSYFQLTSRGAQVVTIADGPLEETAVLAQWSARKNGNSVSERVRKAMQRRAVKGQVLGRPPYGYCVGPERRLELVEDEAALVRYIFRLYLKEGLGIRLIAKRLNEEGYRTRRDKNWSMVTIRDLLRNRTYLGTYNRFGVRVPGNHPAIVSEADFHAVETRMEQRKTPAAPAQPGRFLLSGLVYCEDSEARMIGVSRHQQWTRRDGERAGNTYRYYQNEARTNQSVGNYHTQRADDLEAEVLRQLTGEMPGAARAAVLKAGNAQGVAAEAALAEVRVRGRMRTLDRRLADQMTLAVAGQLSPKHLREKAQSIVDEFQQAERELETITNRTEAQESDAARRKRRDLLLEKVRAQWESLPFEEQQTILRELIEQVIVGADGVRTVLRA